MAAPASFATQLANVRRLTASGQAHQSKPANLLVAVESTISAQLAAPSALPHSATAYYAALLTVLDKACADEIRPGETGEEAAETEQMGAGALIPAILYLLAIVAPETPPSVVASKLNPALDVLLPLFDTALPHPPALRSLLQVVTALLLAAPVGALAAPLPRKAWNYLLELNLDPRPKVRHIAQEGVRKVLTTPIPPRQTAGNHPYLPRAREWVVAALDDETKTGGATGKGKKIKFDDAESAEGKKAIWVIQGLRGWVAVWGEEHLSKLCSQLLSLPPHEHLTTQVYSLLSLLLTPPPAEAVGPAPSVLANLPTIIESLLASPPSLTARAADVPTYLSALTSALIKMSLQDPANLALFLPRTFTYIFHDVLLASPDAGVCKAAAAAIGDDGLVRYCLTDDAVLAAVNYVRQGSHVPGARKKQKTPFLTKMIDAVAAALDSHALKMSHLLAIIASLVQRLRLRVTAGGEAEVDHTGRTAAEELLLDLVRDVGDLRIDKGFEAKDAVDQVVGGAFAVIGVEGVLRALPLNIEPDASGRAPRPGRAHLLPLIRTRTTNDSLAFFTNYFRPLSERVFERKVAADEAGRAAEAKVWDVIVGQIWDCLPGFCEMPRDLKEGLTPPFLSLVTNLLYTQPLLLSSLLRALALLVTSTQQLASSAAPSAELLKQFGIDQTTAAANLEFLRTLAKDMVSVLLNVFSKLSREQRGMVSDVIGYWVGIMTEEDIIATYTTVTTHLSSNLASSAVPADGASPISHTMLDLLIIFTPHLPATQATSLFTATAGPTMLEHADATVQKKSYRLLRRLIEAGKLGDAASGEKVEHFVERLNEVAAGVGPGAQRDRLLLLATLVDALPTDRLHLIPELLSEAVLGTKEVNEKARDAGFDLLVVMGRKMARGGEVRRAAVREDEDDEAMAEETVAADVEEYITMVGAGLTGTTPHMISASINALSRLLFEFKDDISSGLISDLVETVAVFVGSKNREIVKSALGFVKVAIVALPTETVQPHLPVLVPALLGWVHDHKNHFKTKTVHIFERAIRKFGYDEVYKHAPDGGEKKVLENIKRRKDRAKRKKAAADDDDDEKPKASTGNAFDDILYNSDTDLESDEDEAAPSRPTKTLSKKERRAAQGNAYIRNEGDEPMDLLSRSIAGGVSAADPSAAARRRKPGQDAAHFATTKSGKLIIAEPESDDEPAPARAVGDNAYMAAMVGADGAVRTKAGLKFNRNTKRTREAENALGMDLDEVMGNDKPRKKKAAVHAKRLGDEFRAKRAGGDIKRQGGPDPYSYVPIGQAAARRAKGGKVNLTNKKKGSRA
ncbi:pre-rRNA processing protein [Cryptotrichosporon argae]